MKKRNIIALSILLVILLTIAFFQTPIMDSIRGKVWNTVVKTSARITGLGAENLETTVSTQLEELRTENIRLKSQLADYERLKTQLGTPSFDSLRTIPAAIVGRPIDTFQSKVVINKGVQDGVVVGAPVVVFGSTLLGFVQEVEENSAMVNSLYIPTTHLTVETLPPNEETAPARGLLKSQFYTTLKLTTVPRDMVLQEGLSVVTVSKDSFIPHGLLVGTVGRISSPEHEAYQEATIRVPYNIDTIDAVTVLVSP